MIKLPKLVKDDVIYSFKFNQKPRLCEQCKVKWFKPKSANSKYCSVRCKKLAQGEATMRARSRAKKRRAKNGK